MSEPLRVGAAVDDMCRACKLLRRHTVAAASDDVVRVICDYCGSQHNYRGGGKAARPASQSTAPGPVRPSSAWDESAGAARDESMTHEPGDLERLLRRVIREEAGLSPVAPAAKWHGGQLVLRPGREGLQEKAWPIESFFHKIVMLRNRLRTLEQQVNTAEIPAELKLKLQGYVTSCYGTLTSFNVLFAEEEDRFRGSGGA